VLFVRRTGGESQFSTALAFQSSSHLPLRELPLWLIENLDQKLTVETLAARVAMSPRNFARVFSKEFGSSPLRFIEQLRIDTARRLLTESDGSLEHIAHRVGFGSVDTMNRTFRRHANALPSQLRSRA
jgi:transcriptional regulator GlxA family with amidase domain